MGYQFSKALLASYVTLLFMGLGSVMNVEGNTRLTHPNAISFELGGRGLLLSVNYDHILNDDLSVGLGFGSFPAYSGGTSTGKYGQILPFYLNYYFSRDAGSLFVTASAAYFTGSSYNAYPNATFGNLQVGANNNPPIQLSAGLGYEYRADSGFFTRLTVYGIAASNVIPWAGFGFGYSF